jgi:hypothetical protein
MDCAMTWLEPGGSRSTTQPEEIVQRPDARIRGEAAEAREAEDMNPAQVGQPVGHRAPERRASAGTGEEYERWHCGGQRRAS